MSGNLRPASDKELAAIWPAAKAANLFGSPEEMERYRAEAPWRLLSDGVAEAAVLGRWRSHLGICAVRALWCDDRRVPEAMRTIFALAAGQGFDRVLSPLIPEEAAQPYLKGPMWEFERIVTMRLNDPPATSILAASGVRPGSVADIPALLAIDRSAFDEFWRYDPESLEAYLATERLAVAEEAGQVIGYTLSTVKGAVGTLGRLAVAPPMQNLGVGRGLLAEALGWMARQGVRSVTLCTQEHNSASRRLYAKAGFREIRGRLVFLMSAPLSGRSGT